MLDSLNTVKRWDLVPGSAGGQVPEIAMEDEDDEDRSDTERLAEDGVAAAEQEKIIQAAQQARKEDRAGA